MIKKGRLRWFGLAECKIDAGWVKRCMMLEVDGMELQKECPRKTWWDCAKE